MKKAKAAAPGSPSETQSGNYRVSSGRCVWGVFTQLVEVIRWVRGVYSTTDGFFFHSLTEQWSQGSNPNYQASAPGLDSVWFPLIPAVFVFAWRGHNSADWNLTKPWCRFRQTPPTLCCSHMTAEIKPGKAVFHQFTLSRVSPSYTVLSLMHLITHTSWHLLKVG